LPEGVRNAECRIRNNKLGGACESIMVASYPIADEKLINTEIEQDMQMVMDLIMAIRNIRGEMNIAPAMPITAIVKTENKQLGEHLETSSSYIKALARLCELRIGTAETKPKTAATAVIKGAEVYVPLEGVLDLKQERDRLQKEMAKISKEIELFSRKLMNRDFIDKAPKAVVEKDTAKLGELKEKNKKLEQSLKMLG